MRLFLSFFFVFVSASVFAAGATKPISVNSIYYDTNKEIAIKSDGPLGHPECPSSTLANSLRNLEISRELLGMLMLAKSTGKKVILYGSCVPNTVYINFSAVEIQP